MSKKWNDPDARDNYALLITLDNIIISFIFMYVNYSVATNFLSGYNVPLVKTQMKKIIVTAKTLYSHPKNVSKIYAALHTDLAW